MSLCGHDVQNENRLLDFGGTDHIFSLHSPFQRRGGQCQLLMKALLHEHTSVKGTQALL